LINAADYNIHARIQREGAKAFSTGDYASAFQLLKQVSDFLPKDTLMAVNVGLSAQNLSHYNDALTYFLRAKENGIKNPAIYQQLANIYSSKFENELAIQTLKDGLKLNPNNQFLINDYINLLLNNDKFEEASTSISNLLGDDSQNRLYYYLQGYLAQNHQQNLASAETYYLKALALEHDFFAATYQLGLVYLSMANTDLKNHQAEAFNKNIERAFASLDRAYEINPHHRNTIQLLIDIYTRKNRFDKVQELRRQLNEF
jgi:tetratricopeptide (TPR) repeat protein